MLRSKKEFGCIFYGKFKIIDGPPPFHPPHWGERGGGQPEFRNHCLTPVRRWGWCFLLQVQQKRQNEGSLSAVRGTQ